MLHKSVKKDIELYLTVKDVCRHQKKAKRFSLLRADWIKMDNRLKTDYKILCESLRDRYCHLLFVTGYSEKESELFYLSSCIENQIRIGYELATIFHNLPAIQHTKATTDFFSRLGEDTSAIFLTEIEILFDHYLNVNPVNLLKTASRNRAIIVDWPGEIDFSSNELNYATPVHSDHFSAKLTEDVLFFDISGRNSLNINNATVRS